MSRIPRKNLSSSFFHVMTQGVNKEYIFNSKLDKRIYLKILKNTIPEFDINIMAYCVMSNHVHLLINSDYVQELSHFMHKINTVYALIYNNKNNRVGHLFRDRFKSEQIKDLRQLYCCINYIHNNPVKASICKRKEEYEFSSYIEYLYQKEIINEEILCKYLGKEYINELKKNNEHEFLFIDEMSKEQICEDIIKKYVLRNNIDIKSIKCDSTKMIELVKILKDNKISYRIIERKLGIGRETIRKRMLKN